MTDRARYVLLAATLVAVAGAVVYLQHLKPSRGNAGPAETLSSAVRTADFAERAEEFKPAKELVSPDGYVNTGGKPIRLADIVGKKVILLDFWTYSCINCQRTLPYLTSWYGKYKDQGLEIVGVHTPEFAFEKEIANVEAAVKKYGVTYPVVLDNAFATWDAYQNRFWPEHYLIDINGLIVEHHIGEGGYDETERRIQELLKERKTALGEEGAVPDGITSMDQRVETASPETYFGWSRNEFLANGTQNKDGSQELALPSGTGAENALYLGGTWDFANEYASNASGDARIRYRYDARDVYLVASAPSGATLTVMRDGVVVSAERGEDVTADGTARVQEARLYKLIHEDRPGTHTIEIIIRQPGLRAFTFTFG